MGDFTLKEPLFPQEVSILLLKKIDPPTNALNDLIIKDFA